MLLVLAEGPDMFSFLNPVTEPTTLLCHFAPVCPCPCSVIRKEKTMPKQSSATRRKPLYVSRVKVIVVAEEAHDERPRLTAPEEIAALPFLKDELLESDREQFVCLHLNTKNALVSWEIVSVGSLSTSIVHPREVFKAAILANAASVILAHNHPSGDPTPSAADMELTRRLAKAGETVGIEVLDHVILAASRFVSLKQVGIL